MNKRNYKFFLLCIFVLLASTFLLTGCMGNDQEEIDEEEQTEDVNEQEDVEREINTGDFSDFSSQSQEIGSVSGDDYTISFFTEKPEDGFHRFVFEVEGSNTLPHVAAEYRPEIGAIRLTFQEIQEDNSGLGYQQSYQIDEQGIVRIYHNISPDEGEEIYDIGVVQSTEFTLYGEEIEMGKWRVSLDVKYPGDADIDVDMGSDEFSIEDQSIIGAKASDGARITNYSYTVADGAFRFIWTVRGSQEKPIPEVRARYNDDGELVVVFPDLESDYIGRDSNEVPLIGNVEKVVWKRTGSESIYRFFVGNERDFRLSSVLSPNQVILEIKL